MKYEVWIVWGRMLEPGDQAAHYEFESLDLLNAFLKGIDEAVGWLDHVQFDTEVEAGEYIAEKLEGR